MISQDVTPLPGARSVADSFGSCGSEFEHSVQHDDSNSGFRGPGRRPSTSEAAADETVVPVEGVLDSCLLMIAGSLLPFPQAEFSHRFYGLVSFTRCARGLL